MGVINSNKQINVDEILCNEELQVTLSLTAAPDIISNPTDIVLALDRSGSMEGAALANLKIGANTFIDIIDEATDDSHDGIIGNGSSIGIVSFASNATIDTPLSTSVATLKTAVNALVADGNTNHGEAFSDASALFDPLSTNAKVIVMFTDGETTTGPNPSPIAAAARAAGIVIYCIGLVGTDGIDVSVLNDWATDPNNTHVAVTPDAEDLEQIFGDLAENITKAGATNILIEEVVNDDFEIIGITTPEKGNVNMVDATTLAWSIDALGTTTIESALLTFTVRHVAEGGGTKEVNASINYSDDENNRVTFPRPSVLIVCLDPYVEDCPTPVNIEMSGCGDGVVTYDAGEVFLDDTGKILEMEMTLKEICPNMRVALGIVLTETDDEGNEFQRGMKTMTIPAHQLPECEDIRIECIRFVLPDDLNVSGETAPCAPRNFRARIYANYIDAGTFCCQA